MNFTNTFVYEFLAREPDDFARLMECLRNKHVFVPGFDASKSDVYSPVTYLDLQTHYKTKTIIVADRNLVSYWISLVKGNATKHDGRCAAAVMAFAMYADILIEPSMALYEYAFVKGNDAANDDLHWFRVADNADVELWLDMALGRTDRIEIQCVTSEPIRKQTRVDFEMPLRRWRRNYILCLKLAELELLNGDSERRFREFLRWMYDDYLIGWPATLLASYYLAPNSSRKGLLKNIRSEDRNKAVEGVRNATWDITLLTEWAYACTESSKRNEIRVLATLDKRLRILAEMVLASTESETSDVLKGMLGCLWGGEAGNRILSQLLEYNASRDNPMRQVNQPYDADFIDRLIQAGEDRLRNWKPSR